MEKESVDTHKEAPPASETQTTKSAPIAAVAMETPTAAGGNNSGEPANSHSSGSEPDSESSTAAEVVAEVRELYTNASKVDILIRLIQSRTVEVRYQRQLEVYRVALYEGIKEKTRLQLDLAYYDKMLAMLERGAQEGKASLESVLQQHAEAVKMIEELDLKRTQLIKEEQLIKAELAEYKDKFLMMQQEMDNHVARFESESRRYGQLQVQVDKLTKANEAWQKKVCDSEAKQRSMVSAHSAKLNEMENLMADLEGKLKDAQYRVESEKQTNALLKEHTDSVLQEKTQLSMDLTTAENRIAAMEAEFAREMTALEAKWKATVEKESARTNEKMAEMVRSTQELAAEKDLLVAKLTQQKDVTADMEAKLGGMQAILDDRNNEIFSLHSKLNCELKRFEELKQQHSQGTSDANQQHSELLKESSEKDRKIARLEEDLRNQVNTLATVKSQLESKEVEIKQLKEKIPNVDHYVAKITELKDVLADKSARVAQLEQQVERRDSTDTAIHGTENMPAQVTSTPISVVENSEEMTSHAAPVPKKSRITDSEQNGASPSYTNFQGSVHRRTFFKRLATSTSQVSIANTSTSYSQLINNMNLNLSTASTVNVDDEPMDLGNMSSISVATSSVRHVKPFFRRLQEKK
uniref:Putative rho-associated coiled-coil n=1 Tax=Culex tarsalis TaxID=7177 RepID=A0A1Q3FNM8_CULTA